MTAALPFFIKSVFSFLSNHIHFKVRAFSCLTSLFQKKDRKSAAIQKKIKRKNTKNDIP